MIHPVDCAACVRNGEYFSVAGPYCENPRLTTGAGDNFNAGFIFGTLQGFPPEECLLLGVATSGYYVRECRSPSVGEARDFLAKWDAGALD